MSRWDELAELAKEATPGEWVVAEDDAEVMCLDRPMEGPSFFHSENARDSADATFIAAANPSAVLALLAEREEWERLCKQLKAEFDEPDLAIKRLSVEGGVAKLTSDGSSFGARALAASFAQLFREHDAPNYIELKFIHHPGQEDAMPMTVRVERPEGKTPHELRVKAEAERDELEKLCEELADGLAGTHRNYVVDVAQDRRATDALAHFEKFQKEREGA